jgi:hypothetical protein
MTVSFDDMGSSGLTCCGNDLRGFNAPLARRRKMQ